MRPWLGSLQRGASRGCGVGSAELRGGRFFSRTAEARSQRPGRVIFVFDFNSKGKWWQRIRSGSAIIPCGEKSLAGAIYLYTGGLLGDVQSFVAFVISFTIHETDCSLRLTERAACCPRVQSAALSQSDWTVHRCTSSIWLFYHDLSFYNYILP